MGKFGNYFFGMFATLATCHHKMPPKKTIAMNCNSAMIWDSQGIKMKCIFCSYHIKHEKLVICFYYMWHLTSNNVFTFTKDGNLCIRFYPLLQAK